MARYLAWRLFLAHNAAKPELPYVTTRVSITELQGLNKWNRKDSKERALPIVPLSSNKRANTQNHMHASLLNSLDELHYIIPSTKIVLQTKQQYRILISKKIDDGHKAKLCIYWTSCNLSRRRLMAIPKHVRLYCVAASFFRCLNKWWPHLQ